MELRDLARAMELSRRELVRSEHSRKELAKALAKSNEQISKSQNLCSRDNSLNLEQQADVDEVEEAEITVVEDPLEGTSTQFRK